MGKRRLIEGLTGKQEVDKGIDRELEVDIYTYIRMY